MARYLHTSIFVNDMDASIDFYTNKLGLKLLDGPFHYPGNADMAFVGSSWDAYIELVYDLEEHPPYEIGNRYEHLALEIDGDFAAEIERLRGAGREGAPGTEEVAGRFALDRVRRRPERDPRRAARAPQGPLPRSPSRGIRAGGEGGGSTVTSISAPRGTQDIVPPESAAWTRLEDDCREIARRFGYGEIRTPMFEATELFERGVGETTDIVEKEMYTFVDKGGRRITLRPELTAGTVRALLQHNLLAQGAQRLYYVGPFFRYERPQAGRYRQANQFGVECFGVAGAEADVEVIQIAALLIRRYGIADAQLQHQLGRRCDVPAALPRSADRALPPARGGAERRLAATARAKPAAHPRLEGSAGRAVRRERAGAARRAVRGVQRAFRRRAPLSRRAGDSVRRQSADRARARLLHAHGVRVRLIGARRAEHRLRRRPLRRARRPARRTADARASASGSGSSGS